MKKSGAMHIEFMGLPGSGKSTIRKDLLISLKKIEKEKYISSEEAFHRTSKQHIEKIFRYPLNMLPNKLSVKLANKLRNRNWMQHDAQNNFIAKSGKSLEAFFGSAVFGSMSIKERKNVVGSYLEMGSLWECICGESNKEKIVLFEEGFVQKSLMFVTTSGEALAEENEVRCYLDNIPMPEIIIYVKVDVDTCHDRMMGRPDGLTARLSNADSNAISSFLERTQSHLELIADWIGENHKGKIVSIDNNEAYEENVQCLVKRIRNL